MGVLRIGILLFTFASLRPTHGFTCSTLPSELLSMIHASSSHTAISPLVEIGRSMQRFPLLAYVSLTDHTRSACIAVTVVQFSLVTRHTVALPPSQLDLVRAPPTQLL